MTQVAPSIEKIRTLAVSLQDFVVRTPLLRCAGIEDLLDNGTGVLGKLEFLQRTGTFRRAGPSL